MADTQRQRNEIEVRSPSFGPGARIPRKYTGEGEDVSPALEVGPLPEGAETLALILDDPDAPRAEPFVHWMFWDLPASVSVLREGEDPAERGAVVGKNSWDRKRYNGPMPPPGHGAHRYYFRFYALDKKLGVSPTADRKELERAMSGHVLAEGAVMGTYERA